jgi:short-subunit dehydrogenase
VTATVTRPISHLSLGIEQGGAALITGASSGIGETFARTLAARGVSLMLTALPQDQERLGSVAAELERAHGIRCLAIPVDLALADGPDRLRAAADEFEFEPDLIVNSAGVGATGRFAETPLADQLRMIHVNVEGLVRVTHLFLAPMVARGSGAVVNIASTAAFQPLPYFSVYAASKAFVLSFGEALWAELRRERVRVVSVCTGPVETRFHGDPDASPDRGAKKFMRRRYMSPERVVATALEAVEQDRPTVVMRMPLVGLLYYPVALLRALVPLRLRLRVSERLNRWIFEQERAS